MGDYFKKIVDDINTYTRSSDAARKKERAIIVFFENRDRLEQFRTSEYYRHIIENSAVNRLTEEVKKDDRDYMVKKAASLGQVTLSTKSFGRGTDFMSGDKDFNEKGGVHVLQAFFSDMLSEEIQIQGRTARQGM